MKKSMATLVFILTFALSAQAELRHARLKIFGMD